MHAGIYLSLSPRGLGHSTFQFCAKRMPRARSFSYDNKFIFNRKLILRDSQVASLFPILYVFLTKKTNKKYLLTAIKLCNVLPYFFRNSCLIWTISISERVTMMRINVRSSVPRPCKQEIEVYKKSKIEQRKNWWFSCKHG